MKNILKYTAGALLAGLTMTACSPEEYDHPSESNKPTVEGIDFTYNVDQETNTVTASTPWVVGTYPVWSVPAVRTSDSEGSNKETNFYSTLNNISKVFALSGDKKICLRVANANGFSDGVVEKTIHINNSLKDLDGLLGALATAEGKMWRICNSDTAHIAYGGSGTDGTTSWKAEPDALEELALYDDSIVFVSNVTKEHSYSYVGGTYKYSSGEDGKVQRGGLEASNAVDAADQEAKYSLSVEGDNIYLTLSANTLFPFVANDAQYASPKFRIESYSKNKLTLVYDDGSRAWHYILTSAAFGSKAADELVGWLGFTEGDNLLADWAPAYNTWFSGPNDWNGMPAPELTGDIHTGLSFTMNGAGSDRWKAQVHIENNGPTLSADLTYDFSIVIVSSADDVSATVKPQKEGDDGTFFTEGVFPLHAGANVIALSNVTGFDGQFKIALDFAGAPEGTDFTISNVFLSEHNDANVVPLDYNDPANLWKAVEENVTYNVTHWWSTANWQQIGNPEFSITKNPDGSNVYNIIANDATANEWNAQNAINVTDFPVGGAEYVDVSVVVTSSVDLARYTFKFCQVNDDDNTLFYNGNLSIKANQPMVLRYNDLQLSKGADAAGVKLIFDLGGCPADAQFSITDIVIIKKDAPSAE